MRYLILILLLAVGCTKKPNTEPAYPDRLPITEEAKEVSLLPEYQGKTEGKAVDISEGDTAEFDGVLLDETKAFAAGHLRISYDELYRSAESNRKFMLTVITIQERELYRADKVLERKEAELDKLRNSWWARNKVLVGVAIGLVSGVGLALATERLVFEVEEASQ